MNDCKVCGVGLPQHGIGCTEVKVISYEVNNLYRIGEVLKKALNDSTDVSDIDAILYLLYAHGDADIDDDTLIRKLQTRPLSRC